MKIRINIFLVLMAAFVMLSCDDEIADAIAPNDIEGTVVSGFSNVVNGIYIEGEGDSEAGFTVDGTIGDAFTSYDVLVQLNNDGSTRGVISSGNTSLPQSFMFSLSEVASVLGLGLSEIEVGDNINFLVAFDNGTSSGVSLPIPISCPSNIGGTHSFVSYNLSAVTGTCPTDPITGTVTWTELSAGVYSTSDLGFGQYGTSCWNDAPATSASARVTEVCGLVGTSGGDQYGLVYTYTIVSIDGPVLTINWANDYNDSGTAEITREGGLDWPADLYTN